MRKITSGLTIAAFLLLLAAPVALGDFFDGFDTYAVGTTNPGPWTLTTGGDPCFNLSQVGFLDGAAYSPPNSFILEYDSTQPGCNTAISHTITLNMTAQASASEPSLNFTGKRLIGSAGTFNACSSGLCDFNVISALPSGTWAACGGLGPCPIKGHETPGTNFDVSFGMVIPSSTTGEVTIDLDNVVLAQANALVSGANLFLVDYATQQLFNINAFVNSSLRINYDQAFNCGAWGFIQASPNVCLMNNLTIPDFNISLSHAVLITVNVGGSIPYTRTLIPQPNLLNGTTPATQTMYLDTPMACPSICSYSLTVNDFTGFYPAGTTEAFVSQGHFVITSALTDFQSVLGMTMQPGLYNLTLISAGGIHTISQPLTLTATDQAPSLLIQNGSSPITIGPFQQFSYTATWDCDLGGLTSTVTDSLGTMTTELFQLYRYNVTYPGGIIVATHTSSVTGGPGFSVSYDFRNSTFGVQNINASTPQEYKVAYQLTVPSGIETFGQYPVTNSPSCANHPNGNGLSGLFVLPIGTLGLDQLFAVANAYEFIFSLIIVVMTLGILGARMAHISMLIAGGEVGLLSLMSWLPLAAASLAPIFLFIGVLGVLNNRARRPIT